MYKRKYYKVFQLLNLVLVVICLFACKKNDDSAAEIPNNEPPVSQPPIDNPPGSFFLLAVEDEAMEVNLRPELTWSASEDPEGKTVNYTILLGTSPNPTTVVATEVTNLYHTPPDRLDPEATYYWKVVASDPAGNTRESETFQFTTGTIFRKLATSEVFEPRLGHTSVSLAGKIWVIGGSNPATNGSAEVWASPDGMQWDRKIQYAPFSGRVAHASVAHHGELWLIGGYLSGPKNDVWSSPDGVNWTEQTANASFAPRDNLAAVSFRDKLWVLGGETSPLDLQGDVWTSNDGISWSQEPSLTMPKISRHVALVHQDKIWLIGGLDENGSSNAIWNSSDGLHWNLVNPAAPFPPRYYLTAVSFENKLWVFGGNGIGNTPYNDIWVSTDGITWEQVGEGGFSPRSLHSSVVLNDACYVIAGRDSSGRLNDIWILR